MKYAFTESEPDAAFDRALPSIATTDQEHLTQVHARERCYGCRLDVH